MNNLVKASFTNKIKLLFIVSSAFMALSLTSDGYRYVNNNCFTKGEHLEYRVHYGIINAAEASVDIDNKIQTINGRACYNVIVQGKTTGAFDLINKVRDVWQSHIDTLAIVSQQFYTSKREGNYKNKERVYFDHAKNTCTREDLDGKNPKQIYKNPENVQDLISGFYFLRTLDLQNFKKGQSVAVKAFFEGEHYDMSLKIASFETISTKYGSVKTIKINPILPANDFFENQNSIRIWVSNDGNKIPVKAEIDLKIGHLALDLKKFSGLKYPLNFK
jgi:hypothetical protein